MNLNADIELMEGLPLAYIKSLNALVVSDIHLGYEGAMAKKGILMPKVNITSILKVLDGAVRETGAKSIIVNGDIKNDFSDVTTDEFNELAELARFAKGVHAKLILIKGNHDNFVDRYREPFDIEIHSQSALIEDYLFFHGEELPDMPTTAKMLVMGHEHPAISIVSDSGVKERLRCFLLGTYKRKSIIVLPAMNYFAGGTAVNVVPPSSLLSPIFRKTDVDKMRAIVIGYGSTMDFGTVRQLRDAARRSTAGIL